MKTAEEIIEYLEMRMAKELLKCEKAKGINAQKAFEHIFTAAVIEGLLEEIKD